jgi:hypothetical protein
MLGKPKPINVSAYNGPTLHTINADVGGTQPQRVVREI